MAALIAGLMGCAATVAGTLTSSAVVVGSFLYQGVALVATLFWSLGSWACAGVSFAFACCTGCGHRAFSEALRPVEEWDESEAKRAGSYVCCLSCMLSCLLILLLTAAILFTMTYVWYL